MELGQLSLSLQSVWLSGVQSVHELLEANNLPTWPAEYIAVAALFVLVLALLLGFFYLLQSVTSAGIKANLQTKVAGMKELVGVGNRQRFRKRDKIVFYGRKMMRKVKSVSQYVKSGKDVRKRHLVWKFARDLLRIKEEQAQLAVLEPPREYLQEDQIETSDGSLPSELIYMLRSVRVFGHFERPVFLELCKHCETVRLHAGQFLFRVGDSDESVFVVQSGRLDVFATDSDGGVCSLKLVQPGESITSLLSFCDVLTGHLQPYKTISACAVVDSTVIKLPFLAFQTLADKYPDTVVRMVQIIMTRLMRMTFTALHHYLGLSSELMSQSLRHSDDHKQHRASTEDDDHVTDPVQEAVDLFSRLLHLDTPGLLQNRIHVHRLTAGQQVLREGSHKQVGLWMVLEGMLHVLQRRPDSSSPSSPSDSEEVLMFTASRGDVVGSLATLSGEASFFTARTPSHAVVAFLARDEFYSVMAVEPNVVLHVANTVIARLSPFVRQIDFALDWTYIEGGKAIYRQGDASDCMYILLSGRLRSVITHADGRKQLVAEYTRGDLVGIVETLTSSDRGTTVMAIRDTEVARLSDGLLDFIKLKHPMVVSRLIKLLGHRILGSWQRGTPGSAVEQRACQTNFNSVALLAVSDDVPLLQFAFELLHSLSPIGASTLLTSELIRKTLGPDIMEAAHDHRLVSWLAQQEDQHRMTLYLCDSEIGPWTQRCIRQSDCILIVAMADAPPSVGKVEKQLEHLAVRTQKELVLLHREGAPLPSNTVNWLNMRSWCSAHHHVQGNKRLFTRRSVAKVHETYRRLLETSVNKHSDVSRLARLLTGTAVGLVLGGGGARGAAHIGIIRAIQEADIPIDMVGGVSIGALMGALYCREKNVPALTQKARTWSRCMTQVWRQLLDITYPETSWFSGRGFNRLLIDALGENTQVEDLWLPYFTVTTDITDSSTRVHTHGSLWRYVRGSMTLSGYLPPICDPRDGHLLLDGGYVNNLPADVMRSQMGASVILAVDVGSEDETNLTNYGDYLSGWWLLWNRWNPLGQQLRVLSQPGIQSRLAYVSCVRQLEELKASDYCEYIRPPIDNYRTLHFNMFDQIREVGYQHGRAYFAGMQRAGTLRALYDPQARSGGTSGERRLGASVGGAAGDTGPFTDLAQMVCRVRQPRGSVCQGTSSTAGVSGELVTAARAVVQAEKEREAENSSREHGYNSEPTCGVAGDFYPRKGHYSEVSDVEVSEDADIGDFSDDIL